MKSELLTLLSILVFCSVHVQAEDDLMEDYSSIRGLIKPVQQVVLSSEISGQITSLPFNDGERFKKGDKLVGFDCSLYRAEYSASKAEFEASNKTLENKKQLESLNAASNIEVNLASIDVNKYNALMNVSAIRVSRCSIKAPFDGRVIERMVNEFESVGTDQELLSIINDANLEIELIVPSSWLTWLKEGMEFIFAIDETGQEYPASVSQLGAVVDPVSQTIKVKARFTEDVDVLSGMSGSAVFPDI